MWSNTIDMTRSYVPASVQTGQSDPIIVRCGPKQSSTVSM
jgi:hypothetical protein